MRKRGKKLLSIILCIAVLVCYMPLAAVSVNAMEFGEVDLDSSFIDHDLEFDNMLTRFLGRAEDRFDIQNDAINSMGMTIIGLQSISLAMGIANGIVSILKMAGLIEDPTQKKLASIMESVNELREDVAEIDQKVTDIQTTLSAEFGELHFEMDQLKLNNAKKVWSGFIRNNYNKMTEICSAVEKRVDDNAIAWANTWKGSSKTDLRCLYNKKGLQLYSGDNYDGYDKALPAAPGEADDSNSEKYSKEVAFDIVIPAEYLSIDSKTKITADNCVELIREAILAAVKQAFADGKISVDPGSLPDWVYEKVSTEEDVILKIANDMADAIFYEISSMAANQPYGGMPTLAGYALSAFNSYCGAINGGNGVNSAIESVYDYLSMSCPFEGDAKGLAEAYYTFIGASLIQFGTVTSTLAAMAPTIKASSKEAYTKLIINTMKNNNDAFDGFITGNDNYCYPLGGVLTYVDVNAESITQSYNSSVKALNDSYSDWRIVDASVDFDTENLDIYKDETKRNEAGLKKAMISSGDLIYLYSYMNAYGTNLGTMDYLKENGVIKGDGNHSTTILTSDFKTEEHPTDSMELTSLPYSSAVGEKINSAYEEGKTAKPLSKGYSTLVHDKLTGEVVDFDNTPLGSLSAADIRSKIKAGTSLAIRVFQRPGFFDTSYTRYLLHNECKASVSEMEVAADAVAVGNSGLKSIFRTIYTAKLEKPYGALVLDYNPEGDPYKGTYSEIIGSKDELVSFLKKVANGNTYEGKSVLLDADVDMAEVNPENYWPNSAFKKQFKGHFNGGGHAIKNLTFDSTEDRMGLFRTTGEGAYIENLKLEDVNIGQATQKSSCGAVAGFADGNITVNNVEVSGKVSGTKYVGGLIGDSNEEKTIILTGCTNKAAVTSRDVDAGGMLGNVGAYAVKGCVNSGAVNAGRGGAGGIVGYTNKNTFAKNCKNTGRITGYDCGAGVCGRIQSDSKYTRFTGNENTGEITAVTKGCAGGIVGWTNGGGAYIDNKNSGSILCTATDKECKAGGILGGNEDDPILIRNNTNSGSVKGTKESGGIAGYLGDKDLDSVAFVNSNTNSGRVESVGSDAGGIVGSLRTDNEHHEVKDNTNTGEVVGKAKAGGIIGWMAGGGLFESNTNKANITSTASHAGGIAGAIEDDKCEFSKSTVEGKAVVAGAAGSGYTILAETEGQHAGLICGWDGFRKKTLDNDTLTASIFGKGSVILIIIMALIVAAAAVLIVKRKKSNSDTPTPEN